ncbi:MAG: dihydroneopterin aldolase [Bacteroidia bacterium]
MSKIVIEGIKLYCYHGCLPQEARIGANYMVDVTMETDLSEAAKTDDLSKTIDYVTVYEIVKKQMAIRANLIEQPAQRIVDELKSKFPALLHAEVKVTKINPPMNGDVRQVSVVISG